MSKVKYLVNRIVNMDFSKMEEKIDSIHEKTSKSKIGIFLDMVWCGLKYQAGYMDYDLFEMYNLNSKQRATILTRGKNNEFIRKLNDKASIHKFKNKDEFNRIFKKYLKRDFLDLNTANYEEFESFIQEQKEFFAKPPAGTCGKGIQKIITSEWENKEDLYLHLKQNGTTVLEEVVVQHDKLNELHPTSVNTLRIVSILKDDGTVDIVTAYLRIGNGKHVDNFNSGGMVVPVNTESGIIEYPALDKVGSLYEIHPMTNTRIMGFKIPLWNQAKDLVKSLGTVVPEVRLIGWDIAITNKGPVVIEANDFPGHDIYQLPPHRTDGIRSIAGI